MYFLQDLINKANNAVSNVQGQYGATLDDIQNKMDALFVSIKKETVPTPGEPIQPAAPEQEIKISPAGVSASQSDYTAPLVLAFLAVAYFLLTKGE